MTKRILFISNGHGEDSIAVTVINRLRSLCPEGLEIHAWPMVGGGRGYREAGIPVVGSPNLLPSCGFATLSMKWMIKDLRSGWIPTHYRQIRAARSLRGRYSFIVAVGDIVVIAAARLTRTPFCFIGCAKSSYYSFLHGYTRLEKRLLRKHCTRTYPRDRLTVKELDRAGVENRYLGNPMMDDLEGQGLGFGIDPGVQVVGFLPGSRTDAAGNALHMLEVAAAVDHKQFPSPLHFLFAAHKDLDLEWVAREVTANRVALEWKIDFIPDGSPGDGVELKLVHPGGGRAWFVKGFFADVLRRSSIVVGTAGTANEQAVGLGKPLITYPTPGIMGRRYVKMKMQFFGPAALETDPEPGQVAAALGELFADRERCNRMIAAGKERMGEPGAGEAIAREILGFLGVKSPDPRDCERPGHDG